MTAKDRELRQQEFCAYLRSVCALSRNGIAGYRRAEGIGGLLTDGKFYWFGENRKILWDFVRYPGQMECTSNEWYPNIPMGPLEVLARNLDD